ncbi:MFS transporter [Phreatobacter stygius]|nr:MFS transporter [Phreatobacter stygius]
MIALVGTLGLATAFSQFYRNSVGVIATTLAGELELTAAQLGTLSSSFFLVFALCQIPVGIVIDRYGPRSAMLGSAAFVILGSFVFAFAQGNGSLLAGRLLLGIGCSTFLMAPLVIYSRAFPPATFASLTGLQLSISSLGNIGATVPLALATEAFGWRAAFIAAGLGCLALTLAIFVVVRGPAAGPQAGSPKETLADALRGVARATRAPGFWRLFLIQFSSYSTFGLIIGLWGGPYLAHVHGSDLQTQGQVLLAMAVAQVCGMLFWGLADRIVKAYRPLTLTAAGLSVALLVGLIVVGHRLDTFGAAAIIAALGFSCAYAPVIVAHGKAMFPPALTGRGMTLLNIGTVGGGFATQWLTGLAVKAVAGSALVYPVAAFQLAFGMQAVLLATAALVYAGAPDPRRAIG